MRGLTRPGRGLPCVRELPGTRAARGESSRAPAPAPRASCAGRWAARAVGSHPPARPRHLLHPSRPFAGTGSCSPGFPCGAEGRAVPHPPAVPAWHRSSHGPPPGRAMEPRDLGGGSVPSLILEGPMLPPDPTALLGTPALAALTPLQGNCGVVQPPSSAPQHSARAQFSFLNLQQMRPYSQQWHNPNIPHPWHPPTPANPPPPTSSCSNLG